MSHVWAIEPSHLTRAMGAAMASSDGEAPDGYTVAGDVATIAITDVITPTPMMSFFGPVGTACSTLMAALAEAKADSNVRRVVLAVDSPGGIVSGVREVMQAIRDLGKPTVAQVDGLCCSAAYWMASAADSMVATVTSTVGSLGVMKPVPNGPKGLKLFRSSDSPAKCAEPDSKEASQYQVICDDFGAILFDDVALNRGVKREGIAKAYGAGAILPARVALSMGLIDGLTDSVDTPKTTDGARATDTTTPALAGMEVPMKEHTDPAEMSREDLEAELIELRKTKDTEGEEVAGDDIDGAPDESPDKEEEAMSQPAAASAATVSNDIELNRLRAELAQAKSQLGVTQLHAAQAQARVKASRIDALIASGRIGTDDAAKDLAEHAYDAEMASAEAYAVAKGCDLATAVQACPVRLFSNLEARAAGAGNPSLGGTSIGGAPDVANVDKTLATAEGINAWCIKYQAENKVDYPTASAAFEAAHPREFAAYKEAL